MDKDNNLFSNMIKNYDKKKKKKIADLDNRIEILNKNIHKQNFRYIELTTQEKELKEKKEKVMERYSSLFQLLKSRGIIFEIPVENIVINEWENLYVKYINGNYSLINKNQKIIYEINRKYFDSIKHIISKYDYSVVVIRKDAYLVKVQLRIIGKRE